MKNGLYGFLVVEIVLDEEERGTRWKVGQGGRRGEEDGGTRRKERRGGRSNEESKKKFKSYKTRPIRPTMRPLVDVIIA